MLRGSASICLEFDLPNVRHLNLGHHYGGIYVFSTGSLCCQQKNSPVSDFVTEPIL